MLFRNILLAGALVLLVQLMGLTSLLEDRKSWENSNLVCGVTKQKGGKDICSCNKDYCGRRWHGGIGIISFSTGHAAQSGVTSTTFKVSATASLQAISATPLGDSQVAFASEPCVERQGACYRDTSAPSQEYQPSTEEGDDSEMSEPMQKSETSGEQPGFSGLQGFDIFNLQPSQALLDKINGHSSSKANALSNSNQLTKRKSLIKPSTNYHHSASSACTQRGVQEV
ncbi:hypothetical protein K493DRAFT_309348 [Basidiobolus meristosporus CBS 931.73]|uniref:Uncharacterized protein n=1 Tax=Basidiobolus meristosporus CBS 931.73 TaxID=1314790 RepID=A0A1Y1W3L4_9FUNG|nr:hypothetical protein K493DRAFT_309348 [Basidiobolus meristosporus CBS 931.73]|eukprot:ORX68058.1 hypothetical protein K493DRAFT_309348 [Basidiobolus meristosporus CBS 931.73]